MGKYGVWLMLLLTIVFVVACGAEPAAPADEAATGAPSESTAAEAEDAFAALDSAAPTGTFTYLEAMGIDRLAHTATLLGDGRLLVAGGRGRGAGRWPETRESTQIFDPDSGAWSSAAEMARKRDAHTAAVLQDGRVMAVGGRDFQKYHNTTEVYDPATDTWVAGPKMSAKRFDHASVLLDDGTVLVIGGTNILLAPVEVAETCDAAAETCTLTGPMSQARAQHTATMLQDGRVLVAGGSRGGVGTDAPAFDTAEIYDPDAGEWSGVAGMSVGHSRHTATLLQDGRVLVTGGTGKIAAAELFDPATETWSSAGSMRQWRAQHIALLLADGRVLIAGGIGNLASAEIYDPATNTLSPAGEMGESRYRFTATLLQDDTVMLVGGQTVDKVSASAELYSQ